MTSAPSTNIWAQSHASKARRRPACCTTIASKSRQYKVQTCREGRPPRRPYKKRQEIRRQALARLSHSYQKSDRDRVSFATPASRDVFSQIHGQGTSLFASFVSAILSPCFIRRTLHRGGQQ